ncbi:MAG TPA: DMT family transporter [Woeseiaceae bacterium]|nr:DMT family transporter [Woeseiaceae bacterium]
MLAFAGNSILCRLALHSGAIDPASFTVVRLLSGAIVLALICAVVRRGLPVLRRGSWIAAAMLFIYAACFSYAYVSLVAATGALVLFGCVQGTMIAFALSRGERPTAVEMLGWACAVAGLMALLFPGAEAPSVPAATMMAAAGIAWGVYSILGKKEADALAATSANFLRSVVLALPLLLVGLADGRPRASGMLLAVCSGALTSGLGYVIWYTALSYLSSLRAALVQLTVPAITAAGGVLLLAEPLTPRVSYSGLAIVGGVLVALLGKAGLTRAKA